MKSVKWARQEKFVCLEFMDFMFISDKQCAAIGDHSVLVCKK